MNYKEVAANAKKLKKQVAEQAGVAPNQVNDKNLLEAQKMLEGAGHVDAAGGDPTTAEPAQLKALASGPVQEGAEPTSSKPVQKENPEDLKRQQKIAMAIVQIAPTLLGYALGGDEGGAVGANVSLNAMKQMNDQAMGEQRFAQEQAAKKELMNTQLQARKEEKDADRQARLDASAQSAKDKRDLAELMAGKKTPPLTKGQEALDRKMAADYNEWVAQGGVTEMQKNMKNLKAASNKLGQTNTASGPLVGMMPKGLRDTVTPEGAAIQDEIENVVQRNMRVIFGSQFTENEGKQLLARAYNPRQSEAENKRRVDALIKQMQRAGEAKAQAMAYFEENGTLKGFRSDVNLDPNALMADLEETADGGQGGIENPALPKAAAAPLREKPLEKMNPQELEAHNKKLRAMLGKGK